MNVVAVGYRDWALKIYKRLSEETNENIFIIRSKKTLDIDRILSFNPDYVLLYGWSWKVPAELVSKLFCIMLHPSPLPKYRGGSPIQNQIIAGETSSAVTLFRMSSDIDSGNILGQASMSLDGALSEIFLRIERIGFNLTCDVLANDFVEKPQDHNQATYCKRRRPSDSEITIDELSNRDGRYLYDKIRMLEDPYPNAYFRTKDGKRLLIKNAVLVD